MLASALPCCISIAVKAAHGMSELLTKSLPRLWTNLRTMYGLAVKITQPYIHSVGTTLIDGQTMGGLWNTDSREPEQITQRGNAGKSNFCSSTQIRATV